MREFTTLQDDTGFNAITTPGFYSVYTDIDSPKSDTKIRWMVRVERVFENNSPFYIQTAYFYMGGEWKAPKTRHTYYDASSALVWSQWV